MNEIVARRFTGAVGIAAAAGLILEVPLYFVYSGPPPQANVLARLLIGILALGLVLVFATAFRELVKRAAPQAEWAGTLAFASGLAYTVVTLVSSGLEAGAVIATDHPIDPTISVSGTYILYGTISRMLLAMFLGSFGYAVSKSGLLSRWAHRSAYTLAGINLAFMPSLFFGNAPAHFYAANGWGTTALMGGLLSYWLLAIGITTYRSARRVPQQAAIFQPLPAP
ncbi:hypothetical protein [Streptomyces sp. NBC_01500]|uniref:hypothetical protein n=1 Tax=Streptomyces sp. NBC_01500 TaxID=2903886 RepID=UPI00225BB4C7|nr:hypothetical protein [Streptomyces sp. NBC_01500]MCX4552984.1 hypothetical protein [Streptomyces sp. NBC_01500]